MFFAVQRSSITGIGPIIGANAAYYFFRRVSLDGEIALALLAGRLHSSYRGFAYGGGGPGFAPCSC